MLKVLIVDDMDIIRREIKRLKIWGEETGFTIAAEAVNGQAALQILEAQPIDLVITDIKMPKVDGLELLERIAEKKLCLCVVLLSDYTDFTYARQGLILGAFDYMAKPVKEEEFVKLLQRAKVFINKKNRERERLKNLEQNLGEKVEVFFPKTDTNLLIELIGDGDARSLEVAKRMVDSIDANVGHNLFKTESVLKNVLFEIAEALLENKKWIEEFIDLEEFKSAIFDHCQDIRAVGKAFISRIETICLLMCRLQFGKRENDIVSQVIDCVLSQSEGELSLKIIAEKLFMNKTYVSETFKQKTGLSLVEYLTRVKMEKAKKLIKGSGLKTYEIGDKLGYKDIEYFSKLFKKYTGMSPTEFRQKGET